ncbi:MAG TPA: DUF1549 and DUF1553 domain-containing protein [Methylomirabilota bacterium]|nr:DUF1549 and DUF1553 domain-containing protein [Methylomirabilota bacterium]
MLLLSVVSLPAAPLVEVTVHPARISLTSARDRQSIVVQAAYADGTTRDVTDQASMVVEDGRLARLDKAILHPLADGSTILKVAFGGRSLRVPVVIEHATRPPATSFKLDVIPALTKAGCNSGGCHGASRGKDGFRLSLFGYDPDGDHTRITREQIGRRINLALPDESLILEKGLGAVTHTGGERWTKDSELYRTVLRWIEDGAPKDPTNVARVVGLDIAPQQAVLEGSNATQRLVVRAQYSDGTDRDVTPLAVFISNNEPSARVSEDGVITAGQRGEAFVMARFDAFTVGVQVIVVPKDQPFEFPGDLARNNYIDDLVYAKLKKLRIRPSELCDDTTFIRRATLDITGTLPTPDELQRFLADASPAKREHLVETLLNRPEFADLWVMKFAELLQIRSRQDQFSQKAALAYFNWLREQMLANVPIDRIVRELLTATGSTLTEPAANYYQVTTDTLKLAENTAQVFMGMRIQCAQCHNHPFDRWTMNDYYSFANFFPQVGRKQGEDPREYIVFDRNDGDVKHPVTGKPLPPKFLGAAQPEIRPGETRREVLARWLASPDNPWFAKNLANVVWAHFFGRGIIDPVDDVRISNPPSNPELLDALGARFTGYGYDFRRLVRDICTSRTYQLSTRANDTNADDDRNFSKAGVRRLRAEVLLDCINQVTQTQNKFAGLPRGGRAVQIPDGATTGYFLTTFGRATRETVCSCEVKVDPNLSQALHLLNGTTVETKIREGGVVRRLLQSGRDRSAVLDELYLRTLSRRPTESERAKLMSFFGDPKNDEQVFNDLFWALLNAKEFVFNH